MSNRAYLGDLLNLAEGEAAAGRLSRRTLLLLAGAAGLSTTLLGRGQAAAAEDEVVMWDWGGDAVTCHKAAGAVFTKETGIGYAVDPSGPSEGKIKAMVQSGKVTADVCDGDLFQAQTLGTNQGLLEAIDYSIVDKTLFANPAAAAEYGVGMYSYGYAIMYDAEKFGANPPTGWKDVWDLEKFPGKRALYKWGNGSFEGAVVAGGVDPDKVYPIDVDLMLKKIEEIKDEAYFWGGGAEMQQLFVDGEVSIGIVWANRVRLVENATNGRFKVLWPQSLAMTGGYLVPKNPPSGKGVMKYLRLCQEPQVQVDLFTCLGHAPSNPAATAMLPADLKHYNCADPDNLKVMIKASDEWYAANYEAVLDKFLAIIAS